MFGSIARLLFRAARVSADLNAVERSIETGSPKPLIRRAFNKAVGRNVISKLIWRK